MLKTVIVSANILILFSLKFILGGEVSVEQKIPDQLNSGESFIVEVTINKGDHEGFAKWQQKLPEGFVASVVDAKGATFSFKKQEVKLIWMALPDEESITVQYEVKTDPTLKGVFSFSGKFSYLEENERKDIEVESKSLKIGASSEPVLASNEEKEEVQTEGDEMESSEDLSDQMETAEDTSNNSTAETDEMASNEETNKEESSNGVVLDEDGIKIYRNIKHLEENNYRVDLKIEKGELNSFGKIEEYIPEDFVVSANNNEDGIFSFDKQVMKILWMAIPEKSVIEVSYNLSSMSDLLDKPAIHGIFSYLDEDNSVQKELEATTFENFYIAEEETLAEENQDASNREELTDETEQEVAKEISEIPSAVNNEVETQVKELTEEVVKDIQKENVQEDNGEAGNEYIDAANNEVKEEELVKSITDIPSPETSISYKVQIAAGKKEVNQEYFKKNHNISETVNIEYHDSWYKYTLGRYDVYKSARDLRNRIWADDNKINDAFVTAYNAGERISVQEALMISKQKWYK